MFETGSLQFVKWQDLYLEEKPFMLFIDPPKDGKDNRTTNIVYESRQVQFQDLRGREHLYDLDEHGFAYVHHQTDFQDYENLAAVETEYFAACSEILKNNLEGVDDIFIFDWRVRASPSTK